VISRDLKRIELHFLHLKRQIAREIEETFEFDSCFRTIAPIVDNEAASKNNQSRVRGAFKNVISAERIFVKFYIQHWQSENDHIELLSERLLPILTESD
jgi:hypothetical protein